MNLSPRGIKSIIAWETGGESYYDRNPEWPGEASGITIGVGWDLGHTPATETSRAWAPHLDAATLAMLVSVSGRKGAAAQEVLPHVRHLVVPWAAAAWRWMSCWSSGLNFFLCARLARCFYGNWFRILVSESHSCGAVKSPYTFRYFWVNHL